MEKQIILFDIDKTLFDVDTFFNKNLWPAVEKDLGISRAKLDKVSEVYKESISKGTEFDPKGWLKEAKKQLGERAKGIEELFYNPDFFTSSLFPEVIPTLNNLRDDFILGVYSEGVDEWQRKKLELGGINNYFDQQYVSISSNKVSEMVLGWIPQKAVIIDDREDFILELAKLDKVYPIWINRTAKEALPNTMMITSLTQLLAMLERIRLENPQ
ncbi:MAG: HAD family hydrolase [Candidatus Pacebacteria bacterium]|nr:HAD family hydrolase [Candidatus Paceibacterota bacterium]